MLTLAEMINNAVKEGYSYADAEAKVCQDIILKGIAESPLSRNATIKGGVVMRSISNDVRRATQDIDIDFIRYSINDDSIIRFIDNINCVEGITIVNTGKIEELKQQDYHGKRVYIEIKDVTGDSIDSKIDIGVHKNLSIEQVEYCFDIAEFNDSVNLLINSREQMFVEKLRSLLKFGALSTRYKDIFDMYYLSNRLDLKILKKCLNTLIFSDSGMRENSFDDIIRRLESTFNDEVYMRRLSTTEKNWIDVSPEKATKAILNAIQEIG